MVMLRIFVPHAKLLFGRYSVSPLFHQRHRHCERSEAIQQLARRWIASSLSLLAMTTIML
jgi:hypothetical protein